MLNFNAHYLEITGRQKATTFPYKRVLDILQANGIQGGVPSLGGNLIGWVPFVAELGRVVKEIRNGWSF